LDVPDLIVIGGGVTGCAVARDAALRGLDVTLLERRQLGAGTSGRFHGMLQSGARYVTTDAAYAAQCMRERRILERTASHARVDTGGMFVALADDPPEFADRFAEACQEAEIPAQMLTPAQVAAREPTLVAAVRGYAVPDAVFRPWQLVTALAEDADAHGAAIRTGENVTRIKSDRDGCRLEVVNTDGRRQQLDARVVVIAAGPWSRELAANAGQAAPMELAKGSMLVIPRRIVNGVVNRCRPPGSFDIFVPFGDGTIFGTTSLDVDDADGVGVQASEQEALLANAATMVTGLVSRSGGQSTCYAGVRPLAVSAPGLGGAVSRRHVVIKEEASPVLTVVGGSFTTHRAMAEEAVDEACARLGVSVDCQTTVTPLPPAVGTFAWSREAALQPALPAVAHAG
jgi:glycerol-3-phosphate dehydrogenase